MNNTATVDTLRLRILGEFREMPGLSLTLTQASRLFGLSDTMCRGALRPLVDAGVLRVGHDGCYRLTDRK